MVLRELNVKSIIFVEDAYKQFVISWFNKWFFVIWNYIYEINDEPVSKNNVSIHSI